MNHRRTQSDDTVPRRRLTKPSPSAGPSQARVPVRRQDSIVAGRGGPRDRRSLRVDEDLAFRLTLQEARTFHQLERDRQLALRLRDEEESEGDEEGWLEVPLPAGQGRLFQFPGRRNAFVHIEPPALARERGLQIQPAHVRARGSNGPFHNMRRATYDFFSRVGNALPLPASLSLNSFTSGLTLRMTKRECVSCMENIHNNAIRAPCGHYYDPTCLVQLFEAATKDETLYPPRCCRQPIPLDSARKHLSPDALALFVDKRSEFTTEKRVYCARPSCSRFLGAQRGVASPPRVRCPAPGCGTLTCAYCKNEVRGGKKHRCSASADDERVLALARVSGWARCPGCEAMVELSQGCYHMTCRCRAQFCYICRARWKTCSCEAWEEGRLTAEAEDRAGAQLARCARLAVRVVAPAVQDIPPPPLVGRADAARRRRRAARVRIALPIPTAEEDAGPATVAGVVLPPPPQIRSHNPESPTRPDQATLSSTSTVPAATGTRSSHARIKDSDSEPSNVQIPEGDLFGRRHASRLWTEEEEQHLVRFWERQLRQNNDECEHARLMFQSGTGTCDVCATEMPIYFFRCEECEKHMCGNCRRNRA